MFNLTEVQPKNSDALEMPLYSGRLGGSVG